MSDITPIEVPTRQISLGRARELTEHAKTRPEKNFVRFSEVKNRVLAENLDINYPFYIQVGKPTPIGLFADITYSEEKNGTLLEVLKGQKRSALLARVVFSDRQGNQYRDVDIKGAGFIAQNPNTLTTEIGVSRPGKSKYYKNSGLLNRDEAFTDFEYGEKLARAGIRVARTIAIAELEELIVDGNKTSVTEAKKKGIIDKNFQPVIEVRAFGTRARVGDVFSEQSHFLLADARKLVAQELEKETLTDDEYCDWFAQTLGKNIALLHNNGFIHGVLNYSNITLDCKLVDFATVLEAKKWALPERDLKLASRTLEVFSEAMAPFSREVELTEKLRETKLATRLLRLFNEAYRTYRTQNY